MVIIGIIIVAVLIYVFRPIQKPPEKRMDYIDDFHNPFEEELSSWNKGVYVGCSRLTIKNSQTHTCAISPSGGGKSVSLVIPTLLHLNNCSIICLDVSGELYQKSAGELASKGFQVKVLDFLDKDNMSSSYNPLLLATTNTQINMLCDILFSEASRKTHDIFFPDMAKRTTALCMKLVQRMPLEQRHLASVAFLIDSLQGARQRVNLFLLRYGTPELIEEYKALTSHDGKLLSNILATCQATMSKYRDPSLARTTCKNSISFEGLRITKTAIFVRMGVLDAPFVAPLAECYFSQLFRFFLSSLPNEKDLDCYVIIDEAGSVAIKSFPEIMANARKHRVGIIYTLQNTQQLITRYSPTEASTILENTRNKLIFPNMEYSLAKDLSARFGSWSFTREDGSRSKRELRTPAELMNLESGSAILLTGSHSSIIQVKPYYDDLFLSHRASKKPPQIQGDAVNEVEYIKLPELKVVPKETAANG